MKSRAFRGAITALITPLHQGAVAYGELASLVEFQIKAGISGLVPVGTTGESPTVSPDEHCEVVRCTIAAVGKRVPVIAGTSSNSTREAVELTSHAQADGADAMLVVAPYYNRPTQDGLFRHFSAVAEATDRPIVLYSIPGRCGVEIGVRVIERLRAKYPHVNHIKEAGGDDSLTLPVMAVGAQGVISVATNLYPREFPKWLLTRSPVTTRKPMRCTNVPIRSSRRFLSNRIPAQSKRPWPEPASSPQTKCVYRFAR